jgi:hypothetical protein
MTHLVEDASIQCNRDRVGAIAGDSLAMLVM